MLIGVLSDAHGHVGAFDEACRRLKAAGAEALYFLGDAVGYIPDPGVVRRLHEGGIASLRGNHEEMLVSPEQLGTRDKVYQIKATLQLLDASELAFLAALPLERRLEIDGLTMLFVHGSPAEPTSGYVYPDTDLAPFADVEADIVFMGHTHHPFVREAHGRLFVNAGSVGLPRDDTPKGAACLFDTGRRAAEIIRFDISRSAAEILARGEVAPAVAKYLKRYAANRHQRDNG